ncbi:MAG: hypothetical protein M3R02_16205 [Chloroflexota bacterium]|nr:hypothetical protein [Chloroflexota bacterium]
MTIHDVEIFGLEYVMMLGAWCGLAVILTVLVTITRRALARHDRLVVGSPRRGTRSRRTAS